MKVMVTCCDYRRRVAEVKKISFDDSFPGVVKVAANGDTVQGTVVPAGNLEFKFIDGACLPCPSL